MGFASAFGCTTVEYEVAPQAASVQGAATLASDNLLQFVPLPNTISSGNAASFANQVLGLLDTATVSGNATHTESFKKLYGQLLNIAEAPSLVITAADYNALVVADRVLVKQPSGLDCLLKPPANRPRVPTSQYQKYQQERSSVSSALDAVQAKCALDASPECLKARRQLRTAQLAFRSDHNREAIEDALRTRARIGLNDPKLRVSDARTRYNTFTNVSTPWDGREGSVEAWLGSGQTPDTIPGMVSVAAQLPQGAMIRAVDPDWLDYELLVSGQIYWTSNRANPFVGDGITVPRYVVYATLPGTAGKVTFQVIGLITTQLAPKPFVPETSANLRLPAPRTSMLAQSLILEGNRAYASRGNKTLVQQAVSHMAAANWGFASLVEKYQGDILIARLTMWQAFEDNEVYGTGAWTNAKTPGDIAKATAYQTFKQRSFEAYRLAFLFPPEVGQPEPCEAAYLLQLEQFAIAETVRSPTVDTTSLYQAIIQALLPLKTRVTSNGKDCTLFDSGGIDRFVGRAHYRISDGLLKTPVPTDEGKAEANLSMKFLGLAYKIDPLLPANVEWYIYSLLGVLTKVSTPESEGRACQVFLAFRNTLIPQRLATLIDLINKLREDTTLKALMPNCIKHS